MDRRTATKVVLGGALAAPAVIRPESAFSKEEEEGEQSKAQTALLLLFLAALGRTLPLYVLFVVAGVGLMGYDLRQKQVQVRELNQADATRFPVIGTLFQEPFEKKLARSNFLGDFHLIRNLLILNPLVRLVERPKKTIFANRNNQFTIDFRPKSLRLPNGLETYDFTSENSVGKGYIDLETGELLGLFPPVSARIRSN